MCLTLSRTSALSLPFQSKRGIIASQRIKSFFVLSLPFQSKRGIILQAKKSPAEALSLPFQSKRGIMVYRVHPARQRLSLPFQSKRGIIANEKALEKQGLFLLFPTKNHNKTNCSEPIFSVFFATPTRISIAAYCFSVTDKTRTLPASGTNVFSRFLCFSAVSSPLHIRE